MSATIPSRPSERHRLTARASGQAVADSLHDVGSAISAYKSQYEKDVKV